MITAILFPILKFQYEYIQGKLSLIILGDDVGQGVSKEWNGKGRIDSQ